LWLLAAIELVRRSPERLAILGAFSRELEAALAKLSLNHGEIISAGLLDLSMLIRAAQPPKAEDPTTVDWRALLGPNHQAMLSDAEAGNAGACTNIGVLFGVGKEVTRNPLYAAYWYGRAVDLGSDIAAFNLAQMYRHGEGVGKDPVRAYQLTRLAAERGSVPAKCNVGLMLLNGEGCAADPAEARVWLKAAVDEGDTLAPIPLAMLLASGRGGPRDVDRARAYLAPLVKLGNPRALQLLALIDRGL
jgi:TPR repeat protein